MKTIASIIVSLLLLSYSVVAQVSSPITDNNGYKYLSTDPTLIPVSLISSPTTTINKASGNYMALDCTNNVVLTFDTTNISSNVMYCFRLDVRLNTNSLTWDTNYFMATNITSMATNVYVPVIGIRPYNGGLIEVR